MLADILRASEFADRGYEQYLSEPMVQDAVEAVLYRISDACKSIEDLVPGYLEKRVRDVPWDRIYGFRNVAAHEYPDLRLDTMWDILVNDIPTLGNGVARAEKLKLPDLPPHPFTMQSERLLNEMRGQTFGFCGARRADGKPCNNPRGRCPWHR